MPAPVCCKGIGRSRASDPAGHNVVGRLLPVEGAGLDAVAGAGRAVHPDPVGRGGVAIGSRRYAEGLTRREHPPLRHGDKGKP